MSPHSRSPNSYTDEASRLSEIRLKRMVDHFLLLPMM